MNIFVGGSFRINPFISGYETKAVYVTSVGDIATNGVYNIPDNVIFKKTLNVYKYTQNINSVDYKMPIKDIEFVGKEFMTFTKEKPYWLKEFNVECANIGYTQGLCFIRGNVRQDAVIGDGQYMDGGFTRSGSSVIGDKGDYLRSKSFIPWDIVDKDYTVKKLILRLINILERLLLV